MSPAEDRPGRARELYEELKARIRDGTHAPGQALPSTRACAAERGLSRTTVSAVYEQLAAEGFIDTRPGAASRVAAGVRGPAGPARLAPGPAAVPPLSSLGRRLQQHPVFDFGDPPAGAIDFAYGPLAGGDFPARLWRQAVRATEGAPDARLTYRDPLGDPALRRALQGYLARSRGIACRVEQLVVANGSQQVLDLCARLLLDPGDAVAVEDPGYGMACRAFEAAGARLVGVAVDDHGLVTDALPRAATRLAYVTPTHQFPLGGFLPMARRQALLAWAHAQGAWIIEDDYDAEYRHAIRPELTLRSLDTQDRVIYVGTFSKTLSPELRLGYAVLPAALVDLFGQVRQLADRHAPSGPQRALARLIADGSHERHVRRMRRVQAARRAALLDALARHLAGRVRVQGSASGLHVAVWFDGVPAAREAGLVEAARRAGVWVYPLGPLYLAPAAPAAGLVMGFALLGVQEIGRGVRKLAAVLDAMPGLSR